ncbi:MAG TPA: hypothetical protein VGL42_01655 [Opitutaceae bacterium]
MILILEKVVEDLDAVCRSAHATASAAAKKADFSRTALSGLARLARRGRQQLLARLEALGAVPIDDETTSVAGENDLNGFILTYRRCGRRLCLAQVEARDSADTQTADVVFHLLRDLERQLWLLDGGRSGRPVEASTAPGAYQFC